MGVDTSRIAYRRRALRSAPVTVSGRRIAHWLVTAIVVWVIGAPLIMLLFSSFRNTSNNRLPFESTNFTLANFREVFLSATTYQVLWTTLAYAAGALGLALVIVIPLAFLLERTEFPFRRLMTTCILAPLGLPGFVAAMAWILLLNPENGLLNRGLRALLGTSGSGPLNIYSLAGMIFVAGLLFVPSIYLMISGTFSRLDPALEDSSATSGARIGTTLRRVTLPLLAPAILGAIIFYFIVGIDTFEVPAFIGLPAHTYTLTTWIYELINPTGNQLPDYGIASAFGVLTILLATMLVVSYRHVIREQSRFATVGSRGYRPAPLKLGAWVRRTAIAIAVLYGLVGFVLPFGVLVLSSLTPPYSQLSIGSLAHMSFANYSRVLADPSMREALLNTAVMAIVSAIGMMFLALLVSWLGLHHSKRRGAGSQILIFVALGVPSVIIALSTMLIYLWVPVGLYGTIWIIVVAMVARYLPYGTMVVTPALMQVSSDLEDASAVYGATWWRTLTRIVLPVIWPSILRGCLWTFIQTARDATIVLVLLTVGNVTIGALLWNAWFENADLTYASTASVLLTVVSTALTFAIVRFDPMARSSGPR